MVQGIDVSNHLRENLKWAFVLLFIATPAYESCWSRSQIEGAAEAYTTITQDPSHLCYSCGNTTSLTHWARPGIKPTSSERQCQVLNPLSHNGNSLSEHFKSLKGCHYRLTYLTTGKTSEKAENMTFNYCGIFCSLYLAQHEWIFV